MTAPTARRRDVYGAALTAPSEPLYLAAVDGSRVELPTQHWCGAVDVADLTVLDRCIGPTIDVGCGPGRIVGALADRGVPVLGIDVHREAVRVTAARGAAVLHRSVFDRLPGEGRWRHITLMDGNIGIGGAPEILLRRCGELLAHDGDVLVEVSPHEVDIRQTAWFEDAYDRSEPFAWAVAGLAATRRAARHAGLAAAEMWSAGTRRFVRLCKG